MTTPARPACGAARSGSVSVPEMPTSPAPSNCTPRLWTPSAASTERREVSDPPLPVRDVTATIASSTATVTPATGSSQAGRPRGLLRPSCSVQAVHLMPTLVGTMQSRQIEDEHRVQVATAGLREWRPQVLLAFSVVDAEAISC